MTSTLGGGLGIAAAAAVLAVAGQARAAVTVIGGGLAEACSQAAFTGKSEPKYEQLCTAALEGELLSTRDRAGTYVNRGVLKLRRQAWESATKDFDTAIRTRPDLGEAYVNRGAAAIGARHFSESLADINKGLELGLEEPAKAYYNRALAYEWLDDPKSAYFDYQKALEISPDWDLPKQQLARFTVTRR
jgi:tetratricopeptide (TPR) repeat protein